MSATLYASAVDELFDAFHAYAPGHTVALDGSDVPTTGFFVGGVVSSVVVDIDDMTRDHMAEFVADNHRAAYVGMWEDDGKIYLDVSEHYTSRRMAERVARIRGELAIWDVENAREIRTA